MPEEQKVMVIKLQNGRWNGWAVYRSWEDAVEVMSDLTQETWDEQQHFMKSDLDMAIRLPLSDQFEIEIDYMTEAEIQALMPLEY